MSIRKLLGNHMWQRKQRQKVKKIVIGVPILISALSLLVAIIVVITSIRSRNASADKQEASQITTLIAKLENIADGVSEIKSDMRNVKNDVQDLRDRLIIVEQSTKSAQKVIT